MRRRSPTPPNPSADRPSLRQRRKRGGMQAIEFALCLPVWITVIAGILDYGWLYFQQTSLDMAANLGCRAGALVDPGKTDSNIASVTAKAESATLAALADLGTKECVGCTVTATTDGLAPTRTLVCQVDRPLDPLVGLVIDTTKITSRQSARLEFQHMGS